ncbi:hypothetical protein D9M71_759570 [compost metagenome]
MGLHFRQRLLQAGLLRGVAVGLGRFDALLDGLALGRATRFGGRDRLGQQGAGKQDERQGKVSFHRFSPWLGRPDCGWNRAPVRRWSPFP